MSLDVYLKLPGAAKAPGSGIFIRENGAIIEISEEEWRRKFPDREPVKAPQDPTDVVWQGNITHNLGPMAEAAGIYQMLWQPEELNITHAKQLIEPLTMALALLLKEPEKFEKYNPENKWGNYFVFTKFVTTYLAACSTYSEATISISR